MRRGIPTASSFNKIITAKEGRLSKSSRKYIAELLRDAAQPDAAYFSQRGVFRGNQSMQHGIDTEGEARRWYAMEMDADVRMVGFCLADCETYGCSPDGLMGLVMKGGNSATCRGVLELKCPDLDTHFGYLMDETLPLEYKVQVHGQLAVTGADYAHFVSYAHAAQGLIVTVEPDDFTRRVKEAVEEFVGEYLEAAKRLGVILRRPRAVLAEGEVATF